MITKRIQCLNFERCEIRSLLDKLLALSEYLVDVSLNVQIRSIAAFLTPGHQRVCFSRSRNSGLVIVCLHRLSLCQSECLCLFVRFLRDSFSIREQRLLKHVLGQTQMKLFLSLNVVKQWNMALFGIAKYYRDKKLLLSGIL